MAFAFPMAVSRSLPFPACSWKSLGSVHVLSTHTLFKPERVPLELDDVATVGEAVQECRGEPGITEDLSPAGEVQIRGY